MSMINFHCVSFGCKVEHYAYASPSPLFDLPCSCIMVASMTYLQGKRLVDQGPIKEGLKGLVEDDQKDFH